MSYLKQLGPEQHVGGIHWQGPVFCPRWHSELNSAGVQKTGQPFVSPWDAAKNGNKSHDECSGVIRAPVIAAC